MMSYIYEDISWLFSFLYGKDNSVNPINFIVLIVDGISEVGTHVWSDLGYLNCLRHLFRSTEVTKKRPHLRHTCAASSDLPSYICTMINIKPVNSNVQRWQIVHKRGIVMIY